MIMFILTVLVAHHEPHTQHIGHILQQGHQCLAGRVKDRPALLQELLLLFSFGSKVNECDEEEDG